MYLVEQCGQNQAPNKSWTQDYEGSVIEKFLMLPSMRLT